MLAGGAALAVIAFTRGSSAAQDVPSAPSGPAVPRPKPPATPPLTVSDDCDAEYDRLVRGEGSDADLAAWYRSCGMQALTDALDDGRCEDIRTITEAFAALDIDVDPSLRPMVSDSGCGWTSDGEPMLNSEEEYQHAKQLYIRSRALYDEAVNYENQYNARVEPYNALIARRDSGPCRESVVDPWYYAECSYLNEQIAQMDYDMRGLLGLRDEKMAQAASLKAQADAIMEGLGET